MLLLLLLCLLLLLLLLVVVVCGGKGKTVLLLLQGEMAVCRLCVSYTTLTWCKADIVLMIKCIMIIIMEPHLHRTRCS